MSKPITLDRLKRVKKRSTGKCNKMLDDLIKKIEELIKERGERDDPAFNDYR